MERLLGIENVTTICMVLGVVCLVLGMVCHFSLNKRFDYKDAREHDEFKYGTSWDFTKIIFKFDLKEAGFLLGFLLVLYRISLVSFSVCCFIGSYFSEGLRVI